MTEVAFAKTFLGLLDSKPQKLTADHVEDPRNYPARTPYTLPRLPKTMSQPAGRPSAPGAEPSVTVTVRSLRNPPLDIKLPAQPLGTSVLDIKAAVAAQAGVPAAKLRLLHAKKPVADSKVLRDVVGAGAGAVEFSVMVLGGAASLARKDGPPAGGEADAGAKAGDVAQGVSGAAVLETEEFWSDLKGFLQQRIRDEKLAEQLCERFKGTWPAAK